MKKAGLKRSLQKAGREKKVAVVGSGPAGLAAAAQLNKAGHLVTVFERDDRIGGLLTYGIPDVKLAYRIVERRIDILKEEGINFQTNIEIGKELSTEKLVATFDAVILCTGSTRPRDIQVEGRELSGIHFAMDFLTANTKSLLNSNRVDSSYSAEGKNVIVIGGGDTGVDCITTAVRHRAKSITQFDINRKKAEQRLDSNPWPLFPIVHQTEDGHKEARAVYGSDPRAYQLMTTKFVGNERGEVEELHTIAVDTTIKENGEKVRTPIPGTEKSGRPT